MRLASILILPLLASCAHAAPPQTPPRAPGRYVETLSWGGKTRRFILRVPKSYSGRKTPAVMVLHGWTASAEDAEQYTRMAERAEKEGWIAVFPDGIGNPQGWNAGFIDLTGMNRPDDLGFLNATLDQVEREINVDKDREYVAGHSNGAFMANYLGAKLGARLAAIGSMAGTVGLRPGVEIPTPIAPISVILLHGKADNLVAYAPGASALLANEGAVASARFWAKEDGCKPEPETTVKGRVTIDRYKGGKDGTEVELVSVDGAPHDWWGGIGRNGDVPTYDAPAADLIMAFFKAHPKRR